MDLWKHSEPGFLTRVEWVVAEILAWALLGIMVAVVLIIVGY